jgi:hypothetical protein
MNLRISENDFRFRITPADLDALLQGREIDQRTRLYPHSFSFRISPVEDRADMELEMAVGGFCLFVPRAALESLRGLGRSRDGIAVSQGGVRISLQVDIKAQVKRAA